MRKPNSLFRLYGQSIAMTAASLFIALLFVASVGHPEPIESTKSSDSVSTMPSTGPVSLNYATYFGQSINNVFHDVAVDASGNSYAFGSTISQGFDAVVVKYNAAGAVVWQKLLGGSDAENYNPNDTYDYGKITLDAAGNVYVTGITSSSNFPTTSPFQASKSGGLDAFVTKLDNNGNILLSSYLGGAGDENLGGAGGIAVDAAGNIFVAGTTTASGFFGTSGAFQSSFSGGSETDIFVVKIAADFSSIKGTYWGDQEIDVVRDMEVSASGQVWIAGFASESSLTLPGQQPMAIGVRDGLILGFNNNLSALESGTFYGGQFDDEINGLALDASGNIFISGGTFSTSTSFPTVSAFQSSYIGGQEAFAAKLSNSCALTWSTFIGAGQNEVGYDIAVDASGNAFVSGATSSIDFPVVRPAQETYNTLTCHDDGFIFKFNADGSQDWATYYGGWRTERPYSIEVNTSDQVVVAGRTRSTDLPVTTNAAQGAAFTAGLNAFFSRFEIACPSTPIIIHSTENATYYDKFWCSAFQSTYSEYFDVDSCGVRLIAPPGYSNYSWERDGNPVSGYEQSLSIPNPGSGTTKRKYTAIVNNGNSCAMPSTSIETEINWVRPMCGFGSFDINQMPHKSEIVEGTENVFLCPGEMVSQTISTEGVCNAEYQWQKDFVDIPGATADTYTVTEPGCYRIAVKNGFTSCAVYSKSKKFILLDTVRLNNYYFNTEPESCNPLDTLKGCASIFIKARISTCIGCGDTPRGGGLTYTFYKDGVQVSSNSYGYYSTAIAGNYTVEVSNGSCTISSNTLVGQIQPTEQPVWVLPSPTPLCKLGRDSITFAVSHPAVGDSASFRFDFPYPNSDITTLDSFVTVSTANLKGGCFDVRVTTLDGCSANSVDIEIHDTLTPLIDIWGTSCVPTSLRSKNAYSCSLDSVFWYWGDSLVRAAGYDAQYHATQPGDYVLRIKNVCGDFLSDTITLSGNLPSAVISPAGPICLPVDLTLDPLDAHVVAQWYRNPSYSSCNFSAAYKLMGQTSTTLTATLPGYYYAFLTDTLSGCRSSCSNVVEVQRSVAGANLSPSNNIYFCDGVAVSNVTFSVTPASPSFTYQWYRNNMPITGATSGNYTTNVEGVYRVYLENSCDNAFTPVVSIYSVPNPVVTINRQDTVYLCSPDSIVFGANTTQPVIYQWYYNDVLIPDAVDSLIKVLDPGKYTVSGTNNNTQCEIFSQDVYLVNSTAINVTLTKTPSCTGPCTGTISSTVSGGVPFNNGSYLYNWDTGATTTSINAVCEGNHSVTITDKIGCEVITSVLMDAGFTISPTIDSISCHSNNNGKISIAVNGGTPPFIFSWSNGLTTAGIENLGPGTYACTITDSQSCSSNFSTTLSEPTALNINLTATAVTCLGANDGSISALISGGKAPYTMSWNSPVIIDSAMLATGYYVVTVTDNNGCSLVDSAFVDSPTELLVNLSITNTLNCGNSSDGSIQATPSGGTSPYAYLWEDGSTTATRTGLNSGTFSVTITDHNYCAIIDSIVIDPAGSFMMSVTDSTDLSCYGTDDGTISLAASGGATPYTYFANGTNYSASPITGLAAGNYTVYIEDNNGCKTGSEIINISRPDSLSVSTNMVAVTCPGGQDGQADIQVTGGTLPYTYLWNTGATLAAYDTLFAGSYSVTISDSNNCTKIINIEITEPNPLATDFSVMDNSCSGANDGAVIINSSTGGTGTYTYFLDDSSGPGTNQVLTDLAAGDYTLRIVDAANCTVSYPVTIAEPGDLALHLNIDQSLVCFGGSDGSITAQMTGGTLPYSYLWEDGSMDSTRTSLAAGNVAVTVTDANHCQVEGTIDLAEGPYIALAIDTQVNSTCFGFNDAYFTLKGIGGTEPYEYFSNTTSSFNNQFTDQVPGDYSVYVRDANGCISASQMITLTEPTLLTATVDFGAVNCYGEDNGFAMFDVAGGTGNYQYTWNDGRTSDGASDLIAGLYEVTVSDEHNCEVMLNFEITQPNILVTTFSVEHVTCKDAMNGAVIVGTTTGGTAPYEYFLDSSTAPSNNQQLDALAPGHYTLRTVDHQGCEYRSELEIMEPEELILTLNINSPLLCFGGSTGTISATLTGGTEPYLYLWEDGSTAYYRGDLVAGNYAITITDAQNCVTEGIIELEEGPHLEFEITEQNDATCFESNDGSFTIQGTTGVGPYETFANGTSTFTNQFDSLAPGDYPVYIKDKNGCISESQIVSISQPTAMTATIDISPVRCYDGATGTAFITASGGIPNYQYTWNNGHIGNSSDTLIAGNYEITISDSNGCELIKNFEIDTPADLITAYDVTDVLCFGEKSGSIGINTTLGGVPPYSYFLDQEELDQAAGAAAFTNLPAGIYELYTIDANGCEFMRPIEIAEPGLFELELDETISINFGQDAELDLQISNGTGDPTITISPSDFLDCGSNDLLSDCPTPTVVLATGDMRYGVTLTDENGCIATDTISVKVDRGPSGVYLPNIFHPNGQGKNDIFYVQANPSVGIINNFTIVNRWGDMLFAAKEFYPNEKSLGWDGIYRGKLMNTGVYIWVLEYTTIDGEQKKEAGDVMLMR